ncbi:MAG: hypothetical protein V5A37_08535, partial [Halobacteriales archaeon]
PWCSPFGRACSWRDHERHRGDRRRRTDGFRRHHSLLAVGTVFVCGGREGSKGHADRHFAEQSGALPSIDCAIHEAERFDPATEAWERLASMRVDRLSRANALLLDGRVMTCGSNPARRVNDLRVETYRPPYLFQRPRPTVEEAADAVGYGDWFTVGTPDAGSVDELLLVRQSATTHCLKTRREFFF